MVTDSSSHVVVAGGGVFGLASALTIARGGHRVTVCDPARPGANASGVAAGMLAPAFEALLDPPSHTHFDMLSKARSAWPAFAHSIGLTIERDGALWAGADPEEVEARLVALGARARLMTGAEAEAAVPGLRAPGPAVFTPEDWRIDVAQGLLALRAAASGAGVSFVDHGVAAYEDGVARLTDGTSLLAKAMVVAVGAAETNLAPELAGLSPVKGHILRMTGGPRQGPVVRAEGVYVRPHPGGAIVGASMEVGRSDGEIDEKVVAALLARGEALFPGLVGVAHHVSTGVRATAVDGLPIVSASARPGVIIAAGARRNGWLLAPTVAAGVAQLLAAF